MTTKTDSLPFKQEQSSTRESFTSANVGSLDRLLRTVLGSVLIVDGLYSAAPTLGLLGGVLILLSIPLFTSAIMAWDPIYAMLKIRTATFRTKDTHLAENQKHNANGGINNVGTVDRVFRMALSSLVLATPAILAGPVGYVAVTGVLAGFIVMMTVITGWDPIYQLARIRTVTLPMASAIIAHSSIEELTLIDDVKGDNEDIFQKAA